MRNQLLHIFRNSPMGREVLLQSLYFSKKIGTLPKVFIPRSRQFLMHFNDTVVTVNLDGAFLRSAETARKHATEIIESAGFKPHFFIPDSFAPGSIPKIPTDFRFVCCPRTMSDLSSKISLGYIGPKVRTIISKSLFPVLIPSLVFKKWKSVTVFFGGSPSSIRALELGKFLAKHSDFPLRIFTQSEGKSKDYYLEILQKHDCALQVQKGKIEWSFFSEGKFVENLYYIPHDSLVVVGNIGQGFLKKMVFGGKAEILQTILPNNLVLVGPQYIPY